MVFARWEGRGPGQIKALENRRSRRVEDACVYRNVARACSGAGNKIAMLALGTRNAVRTRVLTASPHLLAAPLLSG